MICRLGQIKGPQHHSRLRVGGLCCHACVSIPGVMLATHPRRRRSQRLRMVVVAVGGGGGARRETGSSPGLKGGVVVAEVMQMRRSVKQAWTRPTEGTSEPRIDPRRIGAPRRSGGRSPALLVDWIIGEAMVTADAPPPWSRSKRVCRVWGRRGANAANWTFSSRLLWNVGG